MAKATAKKPSRNALEERWQGIQDTRKRNPRTKEPIPGALGLAYLINRVKKTVEKVAVLSKVKNDVTVQRAIGGQILTVNLSDLRTEDELWFGTKLIDEALLPKVRGRAGGPDRWDPAKLPKTILFKVLEQTA